MTIDFQKLQEDAAATRHMVNLLYDRLNNPHDTASKQGEDSKPKNVQQAADFLGVSRQTIYQNISRIPHRKRHGKLYFFESELREYLNGGLK